MSSDTSIVSPTGTLGFSINELEDFTHLPVAQKNLLRHLVPLMQELDQATDIMTACREAARQYHGKRGFSQRSIYRKYNAWRKAGRDWRALVPKYRNPRQSLPKEFIRFWQGLVLQNKREDGLRGVYRIFIHDIWAKGKPVPGYGTWQEWFLKNFPDKKLPPVCPVGRRDLPTGWSEDNLRLHAPRSAVQALAKRGHKRAHDFQAPLQRDRSKLRPFELIAIDDFRLDQMVIVPGQKTPLYAVGIMALDVATGIDLAFFIKPRTPDEFTGKRAGVRQDEVKELILLLLENWGLPDYPITFLVENAAAAISPETEGLLQDHFGSRINVERTGLYNDLMLKNGFAEKGGKPWEKSWIEVFFRAMHTTAGMLPGQTGPRYDKAPAQLDQQIKYAEKILSNTNLTPADLKQLRLPFLPIDQVRRIYPEILSILSRSHDRKLQGFDQVHLARLEDGDPWQPYDQLGHQLTSGHDLSQIQTWTRQETPAERFQRLFKPQVMSSIPASMLWPFCPASKGEQQKLTVQRGRIEFRDQRAGPEPLTFFDPDSELLRQLEGQRVIGYYRPESPDALHITTHAPFEKRRYLGTIRRDRPVDLRDQEAITRKAGGIHRTRQADIAEAREIQAEDDQRQAMERVWNDHLIHEAESKARRPQTPERTEQDESLQEEVLAALYNEPEEETPYHEDIGDLFRDDE